MPDDPAARSPASASASWTGDNTLPREPGDGFEPATGTVVGRYTVLSSLGRGAAGVVVAAFDPQLDRKVALKFLHRRLATSADHERLRSEAQALARLTHPNVIRVHDVGTFEGRVFMATELVDGRDLASWRAERRPSWREVIDVMLAAGEGLAAAHAAGLVHRDFKPRNVLLGSDGRPRVTDFGQARGYEAPAPPDSRPAPADADDEPWHDPPSIEGSITRTGVLAGTPAYMAPEQLDGAPADPRADQWSFCVSLHELLWGQRPFEGDDLHRLSAAIRSGRITPPPARPRVPAGVRRVLRRGLSLAPAQRFPSMDALLQALRRAAYWRRASWAALPATLAVAAVAWAAWPAGAPQAVDYCEEHDRRLDALWGPARQEAIERAFEATGLPYAATTWARVREHVDGFAEQWRTAQRGACEAEARGEPAGGRMLCLHRRYEGLRSLVELLEQADADVVEHAVEAAQALETIESCESDDGRPAPPADPETRRALEELDALLSRVRVEEQAGRREQALALANDAVQRAEALGLRWSQAEAFFEQAVAADDDGDGEPSRAAFEAAFSAGLAAGHEAVVSRAAMGIAGLVSRTGQLEEAERWLELAAAAIARRGEPVDDLAQLEGARGRIDFHRGAFESALSHFRRSLELEAAAGRGDHPSRGATLLNIGTVLSRLGRYDESLAILEEALAHEQHEFGESHPHAVRVLATLCDVRNHTDQLDAALAACEQGIAFTRQTTKPDDPRLVHLLTNYGTVLFRAGRYAQTEQVYLDALARAERIYGPDDPMVGNLLNNLGVLYVDTKDLTRAQEYYGRALKLFDAAFGPNHPATGILRTNLAMVYVNDGKLDQAEALLRQSIEVLETTLGKDHVDLALSLAELGRVEWRRGRPREAIPLLERAQALREAAGGDAIELADTKYGLALAAWDVGQKSRAHAVLGEARKLYAAEGGDRLVRLEEIDAWLAAHPL